MDSMKALLMACAWIVSSLTHGATPGTPPGLSEPRAEEPRSGGLAVTLEHEAPFAAFHEWIERRRLDGPDALSGTGLQERDRAEAEGEGLARRRREEMVDLMQADPRRALELALPESERRKLPEGVARHIEQPFEAIGSLEVLAALPDVDAPEAGFRPVRRRLVLGDVHYRAFVEGSGLGMRTVRDVPLRGILLDGLAVVAPLTEAEDRDTEALEKGRATLQVAPGGLRPMVPGDDGKRSVLILRVDFPDLQGEPFSVQRATVLTRDLDRFYAQNSYGRVGFHELEAGSAVTPVFRMPRTARSYGQNEGEDDLRADAHAAARAAGYEVDAFDFDLVCMGSVPGFNWAGLGFVGNRGAWIRGTSSLGVVAHELGHNLGLSHANFWDTSGESITGPGAEIEYGDKFDTMGAANAGNYHFNARYKRLLGWLTEGEFTVASTNGRYRIYAQDQQGAGGSRGLQVFANARTNYWLEVRALFTGNAWMMNGVGLRWAGRGDGSTVLLDTTPGTVREKDDSPIVLGRTFSDRAAGIHLTPVQKGGTNPVWMDIVVNRGEFPGNRPPRLALSAGATEGTTSTTFEFQAAALDPDGDDVAYHWDSGDEYIGPNGPILSRSWSAPGEYRVQCTVSDMKGGEARQSFVVRVGNPATFRLSGRVTALGEPQGGVRIAAGQGRIAYTDSDGRYALTGISRGRYTLVATHPDGTRFDPVRFTNPLEVTGTLAGLDFAGGESGTEETVSLIAAGAEWRYWDRGNLPDAQWPQPGYDDSDWNVGAAILGYGGDRETTEIGFGPNAASKYVTAWFRRDFVVTNPARLAAVTLGLLRDDGAVVYLNGEEVVRDNMPSGTILPQTLAANTVGGAAEVTYFEHALDPGRIRDGVNVVAVEVHQSSRSSTDTAFDLRLTALARKDSEEGIRLARPTEGQEFIAPARIALSAIVGAAEEASLERVDFFAEGVPIGSVTQAPYSMVWLGGAVGDHSITAAVVGDGIMATSPPVRITIIDPDLRPTLLRRGQSWRYFDDAEAPGPDWHHPDFDDSTWAEGPGRLGYGEDGEFTRIRYGTNPNQRNVTAWFRREFHAASVDTITNLVVRLQRDDGAAVYLNGVEILREGLPAGPIQPSTLAVANVGDDAEQVFLERRARPTALKEGRNVLAVEVHQASRASSDLGFDLEVLAERDALPAAPELGWRPVQGGGLVLSWPAHLTGWRLEATTTLGAADRWGAPGGSPVIVGDRYEQAIASPAGALFFRLTKSATAAVSATATHDAEPNPVPVTHD